MRRISHLERKYVLDALSNEFRTSLNSVYNNRLEAAFAKRFGVRFAIAHVNGTATLHTALAALGVGRRDEVIVPPLTMSSPAIAVLQNGSMPVFADVDRKTFTLDPAAVERAITPRTRAVIAVSLYGLAPDYDGLLAVCRQKKIALIEDNAQCFLGTYKGRLAGTFGQFSSWSFQASKHMSCGEGGILTTSDVTLADRARKFNSLGYAGVSAKQGKITRSDIQDPRYERHVSLGFNYRLSEINAAVSLAQLERLDELVAARQQAAGFFAQAVAGSDRLIPQATPTHCIHSYWTFAAVLDTKRPEKDWYALRDRYVKNGGDGFYAAWKLSYDEPLFRRTLKKRPSCPNAEYLQPRLLQLKTNYWEAAEARLQARKLREAL